MAGPLSNWLNNELPQYISYVKCLHVCKFKINIVGETRKRAEVGVQAAFLVHGITRKSLTAGYHVQLALYIEDTCIRVLRIMNNVYDYTYCTPYCKLTIRKMNS